MSLEINEAANTTCLSTPHGRFNSVQPPPLRTMQLKPKRKVAQSVAEIPCSTGPFPSKSWSFISAPCFSNRQNWGNFHFFFLLPRLLLSSSCPMTCRQSSVATLQLAKSPVSCVGVKESIRRQVVQRHRLQLTHLHFQWEEPDPALGTAIVSCLQPVKPGLNSAHP